jgi:diguanylate cyclase (GGDEF)-like protein
MLRWLQTHPLNSLAALLSGLVLMLGGCVSLAATLINQWGVSAGLVISAAAATLCYWLACRMLKPIHQLAEAAERISNGAEDVRFPIPRIGSEVSILATSFVDMKARLDERARSLERSQRDVEEANRQLLVQNEMLQRVNEALEQLSITDGLTKLHNHRFFHEHLAKEVKRADRSAEPLALILADIDHFKSWNDRLGHAAGDEILRRVAIVMSELVRESDLLARYGGEEFALIAPNTEYEGAVQLAEKIRARIAATPFFIEPPSERRALTVSIGVALYQGDHRELFNDADRALYAAKDQGRDCVVTHADLEVARE